MIDSKRFFNVSSSPWVHPFPVCDFYEFSPVFRDLSSWLSILVYLITLTSLDAYRGIYTCCALFKDSADLALGVYRQYLSCALDLWHRLCGGCVVSTLCGVDLSETVKSKSMFGSFDSFY